ncbi:N-acetylglutamate synthase [Roseimicrobium gellanilyticum]|uniref:amino-acid N-acetyltransferase n=1 Tax=Roseimicrobium gellanilyticum TaxID=748857 RepID=A0A366HPA2_9BACT|nr:amino-acid N-acetyltransferase [Roseimicrobium gellanilyticum]RBP44280.1 N-acetylglutamate synthase [Roseimicrobium gellanilyticum]
MRFEDLRGILQYVPQFKERIFVIAFDGAVMRLPNFHSLLQDIAVLQSLSIQVVVVFGARKQIQELADLRGVKLTSDDGMGLTDAATLEVSADAISRLTSELMGDLTALELRVAVPNALAVHPAGVIEGVDLVHTGRIERVDQRMLLAMLKEGIIPVLPPLGYDGRGATLRVNSDEVAVDVALELDAAKVIFVAEEGLVDAAGQRLAQISVGQAREMAKRKDSNADPSLLSKLKHAALACNEGVPRVHIIDGRQDEVLLAELFSNEGVGTMIHADDYQHLRKARTSDIPALQAMMRESVEDAALAPRTREQMQKSIGDFYVLELDGNPVASVAVHVYELDGGVKAAELACLFVRRAHKNKGHGRKLVAFAEDTARQRGCAWIFALSTQAFRFFEEKMGYKEVPVDTLPAKRREAYDRSGRNSRVLKKAF